MTVFDGEGEAISGGIIRVAVEILIYSDTLTAGEVSARLDLQPSRVAEKGPRTGAQTGKVFNIPRHMWLLSSEDNVGKLDFADHLDWLLSKLLPLRDRLLALREAGTIECRLNAVVWTENDGAIVSFAVPQMQALASLQLHLEMEFADYGTD